jgi:hypothetical protein
MPLPTSKQRQTEEQMQQELSLNFPHLSKDRSSQNEHNCHEPHPQDSYEPVKKIKRVSQKSLGVSKTSRQTSSQAVTHFWRDHTFLPNII